MGPCSGQSPRRNRTPAPDHGAWLGFANPKPRSRPWSSVRIYVALDRGSSCSVFLLKVLDAPPPARVLQQPTPLLNIRPAGGPRALPWGGEGQVADDCCS